MDNSKDIEKLYNRINDFWEAPIIQRFQALCREDCFSFLGQHRTEDAYSHALAWFFDTKRNDILGLLPIQSLINLLQLKSTQNIIKSEDIINCKADREVYVANSDGRMDIVLEIELKSEKPFKIVIENKIKSGLSEGQLETYLEDLKAQKDYLSGFLIIALHCGTVTKHRLDPKEDPYVELTYDELLNRLFLPINKKMPTHFISELIHSIITPRKINKTQYNLLGMTPETKEILEKVKEFLVEYKELCLKANAVAYQKKETELDEIIKAITPNVPKDGNIIIIYKGKAFSGFTTTGRKLSTPTKEKILYKYVEENKIQKFEELESNLLENKVLYLLNSKGKPKTENPIISLDSKNGYSQVNMPFGSMYVYANEDKNDIIMTKLFSKLGFTFLKKEE